jgi:hypothetical protein
LGYEDNGRRPNHYSDGDCDHATDRQNQEPTNSFDTDDHTRRNQGTAAARTTTTTTSAKSSFKSRLHYSQCLGMILPLQLLLLLYFPFTASSFEALGVSTNITRAIMTDNSSHSRQHFSQDEPLISFTEEEEDNLLSHNNEVSLQLMSSPKILQTKSYEQHNWHSDNVETQRYLITAASSSVKKVLETTSESDNASFGNMFDVQAEDYLSLAGHADGDVEGDSRFDAVIYGITGIHMSNSSTQDLGRLEIYTKPGTYIGHEFNRTAWTLVLNTTLQGESSSSQSSTNEPWTKVPNFDTPVVIADGARQAFFVTLAYETLLYTSSNSLTQPSGTRIETASSASANNKSNDELLDIYVGIAVNQYPPFQAPATADIATLYPALTQDRIFNGQVTYAVEEREKEKIPKLLSKVKNMTTPMEGGNQNFGTIFDVTAASADAVATLGQNNTDVPVSKPMTVQITSLDFVTHVLDKNVTVHIMARRHDGSFLENAAGSSDPAAGDSTQTLSNNDWWLVCSTTVVGKGSDTVTSIPRMDFTPVAIPRGKTKAFVILLDQKELVYSNEDEDTGEKGQKVLAHNNDLAVWIGQGVEPRAQSQLEQSSSFTRFPNRSFNGVLHYQVELDGSPTSAPTEAPTSAPTFYELEEEVILDEATATPLRTQQVISLRHISKKNLRKWRQLGVDMMTTLMVQQEDRQDQGITEDGENSSVKRVHHYERLLDVYYGEQNTDLRNEAPVVDKYFDPYVLLYVETSVHEFLHPYLVRNDPPIALSNVHIYEGVPPDAKVYVKNQNYNHVRNRDRHKKRLLAEEGSGNATDSNITSEESLYGMISDEPMVPSSAPSGSASNNGGNTEGKTGSISIDFYTTIDGEYNPPPNIDFDALVETYFFDAGEKFVERLRSSDEEKGRLFEEVEDNVNVQRVEFSVPDELLFSYSGAPPVRYSASTISLILSLSAISAAIISAIVLTVSCKKRRVLRKAQEQVDDKRMHMERQETATAFLSGQGGDSSAVTGAVRSAVTSASQRRMASMSRLNSHTSFQSRSMVSSSNQSSSLISGSAGGGGFGHQPSQVVQGPPANPMTLYDGTTGGYTGNHNYDL